MLDDELCQPHDALLRADQRLQWHSDLLCDLLSRGVRCCRFRQFFFRRSHASLVNCQLDDARFVVERLRGPILNGLTDVVHVRVLPEDMARVPVIALQWRFR